MASPTFAHPDVHGRPHFKGLPMNPTAVMRAFEGDAQPSQSLQATASVACVDGFADIFPCRNVDLLALVPLADLGAVSANDIWGWSSGGREFALIGLNNGTVFVEITVPASPVYVGKLPTHTTNSSWRDIKVYQDHAFIVSEAGAHGMQVFNLTRLLAANPDPTPITFTEDALYNGFGNAHNIVINEQSGYAYAVGTNTCSGGLHIVDITTPTVPKSRTLSPNASLMLVSAVAPGVSCEEALAQCSDDGAPEYAEKNEPGKCDVEPRRECQNLRALHRRGFGAGPATRSARSGPALPYRLDGGGDRCGRRAGGPGRPRDGRRLAESADGATVLFGARAAQALALAATQSSGLTASFGTMAKPFHAGKAAMDGILSSELAAAGMSAAPEVLEPGGGLDRALIQDESLSLAAADFSGWKILRNSFKPYAACHLTHPAIDAARAVGVALADIRTARAVVAPLALQITGQTDGRPETALAGKFDLKYCVAMALHGHGLSAADFQEPWRRDTGVAGTAAKIAVRSEPAIDYGAARLEIGTADGGQTSVDIEVAKGHPGNPMSWDDMRLKFDGLVEPRLAGQAGTLFALLRNFGSGQALVTIRELLAGLRPGAALTPGETALAAKH